MTAREKRIMEQDQSPQFSTIGVPITSEQHPDFIWTWKSNSRSDKASLWLPYFSKATHVPRRKLWLISYNGGEITADLAKIDLIMFYGASGELPLEFLDDAARHGIILMIHRRNLNEPYFFFSGTMGSQKDAIARQILLRDKPGKAAYIAKVLIRERFRRMESRIPISKTVYTELARARTVTEVRNIEALITEKYWAAWYEAIGIGVHRRDEHPVNAALDAGSVFLAGVLLRWVLFHKLSPNHGYLHEQTRYPALVYDLIEPFRYIFEDTVFAVWSKAQARGTVLSEKEMTQKTLDALKAYLDKECFVPATRQSVRRKNLLHGAVLALRSYLLSETEKFVLPSEGEPNGGRPPKVGFRLPGPTKRGDLRRFRRPKTEGVPTEAAELESALNAAPC